MFMPEYISGKCLKDTIDNVPLQTKDERKELFRIIGEIKSTAEDRAEL